MLLICGVELIKLEKMNTTTVRKVEISKFLYAAILVAVYTIAVIA